jgi:hypothetical protein
VHPDYLIGAVLSGEEDEEPRGCSGQTIHAVSIFLARSGAAIENWLCPKTRFFRDESVHRRDENAAHWDETDFLGKASAAGWFLVVVLGASQGGDFLNNTRP